MKSKSFFYALWLLFVQLFGLVLKRLGAANQNAFWAVANTWLLFKLLQIIQKSVCLFKLKNET